MFVNLLFQQTLITAGLLVNWLKSSKPDLIIGTLVFVIKGALNIFKIGK
jgi:hypothetical protein